MPGNLSQDGNLGVKPQSLEQQMYNNARDHTDDPQIAMTSALINHVLINNINNNNFINNLFITR